MTSLLKRLALLCVFFPALALAQTTTPNLHFNQPAYGSTNWGPSWYSNFTQLDLLLSGNEPIQLTTWQTTATYAANVPVWYLGTSYTSLSNGNQGNLPTNATFWTPTLSVGDGSSTHIVYGSAVVGATPGQAVAPGSSATGDTDSAAVLNAVLAAGNTNLVLDSGFALSASLVLYSGDTISCTTRQNGVIMMVASNATPIINAHQNAPTTASGTGGFLTSNITDTYLSVHGCTVNGNATQAVTGTNSEGVAHGATPGGLFTYGIFFAGVNHFSVYDNEIYDTGAFSTLFTNTIDSYVLNNNIHQPTPTVAKKFTDGVHYIGPDKFGWIANNRINAGDDSIALNADDGNRTGSGDINATYIPAFVKWGPETDFHIDNDTLDATSFGLRLYSATELIDRVEVTNLNGQACGQTGTIVAQASLGVGNMGTIKIDGWNLQTSGSCNSFSSPYNFILQSNITSLEIDHVASTNPAVNWPIITQQSGAIGSLILRDWTLTTGTSTFGDVLSFTGGSVNTMVMNGLAWHDSVGSGNVFSGSVVPTTITCSNYAGPNLLLASGFAPAVQNGDCFTNSYGVTYVNTVFNEAGSGTNLAGTTPATCTGCSGGWTLASGTDFKYQSGGGIATSTANANVFDLLNIGRTAGVVRADLTACTGTGTTQCQVALRYTNINNFIAVNINPPGTANQGMYLYDVVGGVTTAICDVPGATVVGNYTFAVGGTGLTATGPLGTCSGTTANTGTDIGLSLTGSTMSVSSLSVKSN